MKGVGMTDKFVSPEPPLSSFESELVTILNEECSEVIQRGCKMERFGKNEIQPGQGLSNLERLSEEVGDLLGIIDKSLEEGLLDANVVQDARTNKQYKLLKYMQTTKES